jgi:hypothetical protein
MKALWNQSAAFQQALDYIKVEGHLQKKINQTLKYHYNDLSQKKSPQHPWQQEKKRLFSLITNINKGDSQNQ